MIALCNTCKNERTEPQWLKREVKRIKGRWKDGRWLLDEYFRQHCAAKRHSSTPTSREPRPEVKYCTGFPLRCQPQNSFRHTGPYRFWHRTPSQKSPASCLEQTQILNIEFSQCIRYWYPLKFKGGFPVP